MYIIISVNYREVTMVINDIFEVLRIRKIIEKTKLTKSLILAAKA
jgi:hypothetical protein